MNLAQQITPTVPPSALPIIKQCSKCGAVYTHAEWRRLDLVGFMSDGKGGRRELRNCSCTDCHSTISIEVAS